MSTNTQSAKKNLKAKFDGTYKLGINSSKNIAIAQDIQLLAEKIINYIETKNSNYVFTDFYDPTLVKYLRALIKNEKEFKEFLNTISFDLNEFIEISAYIIPHVYTSHLIKYIRTKYLGLTPIAYKK